MNYLLCNRSSAFTNCVESVLGLFSLFSPKISDMEKIFAKKLGFCRYKRSKLLILDKVELRVKVKKSDRCHDWKKYVSPINFELLGSVWFRAINFKFTVTFKHQAITPKIICIEKISICITLVYSK
jgi:hypothetical protein